MARTRPRKGNYEPKIIGKYDRNAEGTEDKILALYARGMSQWDIAEHIKSLYDVEISPELVSKISEKIMPEVSAWQNRPLESVYRPPSPGRAVIKGNKPLLCTCKCDILEFVEFRLHKIFCRAVKHNYMFTLHSSGALAGISFLVQVSSSVYTNSGAHSRTHSK